MPRLINRVPKYNRHRGDRARVKIDGKYHYLGEYGSPESKEKYNALITKWRQQQETNEIVLEDRWLIVELATEYVDYIRQHFGEGHNRATSIIPVIRRFGNGFAEKWADEFTPDDLLKARQIWIDRGCSRSYVNRCVQTIIRCFKWAVTKRRVPAQLWQELAAVEPLRKGRPGARETPKVKSVPEEVVTPVLAFLLPTVADMVRLQMLPVLRPRPGPGARSRPGECLLGGPDDTAA